MNKNLYFLAISGLQKAVRLGDQVSAIKCFNLAYNIDKKSCLRRFWTIIFEECLTDKLLLDWLSKFDFESSSDKCREVVKQLCLSPNKSAISIAMWYYLFHHWNFQDENLQDLREIYPEKFVEDFLHLNRHYEDTSSYVDGCNFELPENILGLAYKAEPHTKISCGFPLMYAYHDELVSSQMLVEVENKPEDQNREKCGFFYLSAMDQHTSWGKWAIKKFCSNLKLDPKVEGWKIFRNEGMNQDKIHEDAFRWRERSIDQEVLTQNQGLDQVYDTYNFSLLNQWRLEVVSTFSPEDKSTLEIE